MKEAMSVSSPPFLPMCLQRYGDRDGKLGPSRPSQVMPAEIHSCNIPEPATPDFRHLSRPNGVEVKQLLAGSSCHANWKSDDLAVIYLDSPRLSARSFCSSARGQQSLVKLFAKRENLTEICDACYSFTHYGASSDRRPENGAENASSIAPRLI